MTPAYKESIMSNELYTITKVAIDDLKTWMADNPGNDEPHDEIFEIADSSVPVYNYDLLQLAAENLYLGVDEPELGPAFDGSPTPCNIIAANVFEHVEGELWEDWNDHKDDWLEDEEA
jgi:hypothetical protein